MPSGQQHSFEEIRGAALDIIAGRERTNYEPSQYNHLELGVAEVLARREGPEAAPVRDRRGQDHLSAADQDTFLEVFWSLFQQGLIVLGRDRSNNGFPWFRISRYGQSVAENDRLYFFHDVTTYEAQIRANVPDVHDTTVLYLKESMQAFRTGCLLSAAVMLGVATEHHFMRLLDTVSARPEFKGVAAPQCRTILQKFNTFRAVLEQQHLRNLPPVVREDLETQFGAIQSVIRTTRNESGHPTGRIPDREGVYVLLHLFIPYAKKVHQLRVHFESLV